MTLWEGIAWEGQSCVKGVGLGSRLEAGSQYVNKAEDLVWMRLVEQ